MQEKITESILNGGDDWISALFADYDQDGEQDISLWAMEFKRPNDLDYVKYYSNDQKKQNKYYKIIKRL
jgi:hypothetical protein